MNVVLRYRNSTSVMPLRLALLPEVYSWHAIGGPEQAEIRAAGGKQDLWECLETLRCPVEIYDRLGRCVWWGYVHEVEIDTGTHKISVSLDTMANRLAGIYGGGYLTAWSDDLPSQSEYGIKEILLSVNETVSTLPEQQVAMALAEKRYPLAAHRDGHGLEARLLCRGWWQTLGWRYFATTKTASAATTAQIATIIAAKGAWLTATDIVDASGVTCSQYREGHETAQAIIERFLAAGVSGGRRLLSSVTQARRARIYQEPAKGASDYSMDARGRLFDQYAAPVPLQTCPVGVWVLLRDLLPSSVDTTRLTDAGRYFLERSEYEVSTGRLTREPRGEQSPWEVVEVEEG